MAVAPSPFPFDVDLGTDATGRTVAVYSRCAAPTAKPARSLGGRHRARSLGGVYRARCRLFELDPGDGRERPLREIAARGVSQVRPAIDRGILAYAQLPGAGTPGTKTRIMLKRLGSASPARTIASFDDDDAPTAVLGIDYEDRRVTFAVLHSIDPSFTVLYLKQPGGAVSRVAAGGFGEENAQYVSSPSLAGRHLYWSYANRHAYLEPNGFVVRRDLLTGQVSADEVPGNLVSVAADAAAPARALLIVSDRTSSGGPERYGSQRMRRVRRPSFVQPPAKLGLRTSLILEPPEHVGRTRCGANFTVITSPRAGGGADCDGMSDAFGPTLGAPSYGVNFTVITSPSRIA